MRRPQLATHKHAQVIMAELCTKTPGITDEQLAQFLLQKVGINWSPRTVHRARITLGLNRDPKGAKPEHPITEAVVSLTMPPHGLNEREKADWFRNQFRSTHLYQTLVSQFDPDEVAVYMEEYGHVCLQFEDIVVSEFFQIDDFLKHRILINRQLLAMKRIEREIEKVTKWIDTHPMRSESTKEEKQERLDRFRTLEGLMAQSNKAHERYDKLVSERNKLYQSLSATRRDRISELKGSGDSFLSLVSAIQSSAAERNRHGQYAELTKLAGEDAAMEFRTPVTFPDGSKDPIFLDAETEINE